MTSMFGSWTRAVAAPGATAERAMPPSDPHDFSVLLGGPLYRRVRRAHLSGDALELLRRRIVVITLLVWLPLLILSALGGRAWSKAVTVPVPDGHRGPHPLSADPAPADRGGAGGASADASGDPSVSS